MKKIIISMLALSALVFTSCGDDPVPAPPVVKLEAPATYKFEKDGKSTVSFSGQVARLKMAGIIASALKDENQTKQVVANMFTNSGNPFADADLNSSTKQVRSKVAASPDYFGTNTTDRDAIRAEFDGWIADQFDVVFVNKLETATAGNAGKIGSRYVNGKGVEFNQMFAKGLIGALITDQILNGYLSTTKLNVENESNKDGKNYTAMEHHWDEAYGYLYGLEANPASPVLGADSFLNKYLKKVNGNPAYAGVADDIFNAFKLGRAAIVAKRYDVRDQQVKILREKISKVVAIRTIHYLQAGKGLLASDKEGAFHDLSEGLGFLYSLQFTRKPGTDGPYMTKAKVDEYVALLTDDNGLWEADTEANLDTVSNAIATAFGLTLADAAK